MEDQKYRDEEDLAEKLEGLKSKQFRFHEAQSKVYSIKVLQKTGKFFICIHVFSSLYYLCMQAGSVVCSEIISPRCNTGETLQKHVLLSALSAITISHKNFCTVFVKHFMCAQSFTRLWIYYSKSFQPKRTKPETVSHLQ